MATLILAAVGASIGGAVGTGLVGLAGATLGQAAGAALGRVVDQKLLGSGSEPVEVGRVDRFRIMGASEGLAIPRLWGRNRVGGQVIWAGRFREERNRRRVGGGKGSGRKATVTEFSYSVSLAIALCEGPIQCVGRVWADGNEIAVRSLTMRVYPGDEDQLPDPLVEAVEGVGKAGAYRGVAYVVIEDLDLGRFGNRVPQFSFEVVRAAQDPAPATLPLAETIQAVALIPGTGEYALATTKVRLDGVPGGTRNVNVHSIEGRTDLAVSLAQLRGELPQVGAVSLVVSWFGDDLRCGSCTLRPMVEQRDVDSAGMPWRAGGIGRTAARVLPASDGRSVYGGTPSDQSVVQAIAALRAGGQEVMFYPFILMTQLQGNGRPDPWGEREEQANLPWRGRITLDIAPGREGTPDGSAEAEAQVAAFFGTAERSDFSVSDGRIVYSGPAEWSYRRFILHYAYLCALAGGVEAFCVGSELRGLTRIRGANDDFPAVRELMRLADDARAILGSATRIGYAADWSEYSNYRLGDDLYFNLDPLWAHPNIDFVGIDNYMPLSDWRHEPGHRDATWGSATDPGYLAANVEGGEGFDWYYDSDEGWQRQARLPITDGAYGEDWVFRWKDLRSWWSNPHHNRIGGARVETGWQPASKPIWFTEYGCPALDHGTNQPNVFVDPKSSESALPRGSRGLRDDFVQMQYFSVLSRYWSDPERNPPSPVYGGPMLDMSHAFAWAWDARPFPAFPSLTEVWDDGANHARGHWLNGRTASQPAASVLAEVIGAAGGGVGPVSGHLPVVVRGYTVDRVSTLRSAVQPILLAFAVDPVEREGQICLISRGSGQTISVLPDGCVVEAELDGLPEVSLAGSAAEPGALALTFVRDAGSFEAATVQSVSAGSVSEDAEQVDLPMLLTGAEARAIADRWSAEARLSRQALRLALPPSQSDRGPGDVLLLDGLQYRVDRIERGSHLLVEATRTDSSAFEPTPTDEDERAPLAVEPGGDVDALFLDLPLIRGDETPHAPSLAVSASPWPGPVALWDAVGEDGFELNTLVVIPAMIGVSETAMAWAQPGLRDRGPALRVRFPDAELASVDWDGLLAGANLAAIGSGAAQGWEVFQFARAELVAPGTFELSLRLRGQFGTDADVPPSWPEGSRVVILDDSLRQIDLAPVFRRVTRTYRIGSADRGFADEDTLVRVESFSGIGLRPYPVAHLSVLRRPGNGAVVSWVRRTRVDGDDWDRPEVPLGEDREWYQVQVRSGDLVLREAQVVTPEWLWSESALNVDLAFPGLEIWVAQGSDRFGPGPYRKIEVAV